MLVANAVATALVAEIADPERVIVVVLTATDPLLIGVNVTVASWSDVLFGRLLTLPLTAPEKLKTFCKTVCCVPAALESVTPVEMLDVLPNATTVAIAVA